MMLLFISRTLCFGAMFIILTPAKCSNILQGEAVDKQIIDNQDLQENQTDQVLRELSVQLSQVNSVAELYNLMVRYNHQYCTADLLHDLKKMSKTKSEKIALEDMKNYCERLENQHELKIRALPVDKATSNAALTYRKTKQSRAIIRRANNHKMMCRTKKVVIELPPSPPGSFYHPRCTMVRRCSGCCKNPLQTCTPEPGKIKYVKRKVFMIQKRTEPIMMVKELRIEEHTSCKCDCPRINASYCTPLQEFDGNNCSCKCRNGDAAKYCFQPRSWNHVECRCQCPPSLGCTSGRVYDEQTCRCVKLSDPQRPGSREKDFNQIDEKP